MADSRGRTHSLHSVLPHRPECLLVMVNKIVLAWCVAAALLAGCKQQTGQSTTPPGVDTRADKVAADTPVSAQSGDTAEAFDINRLPVSTVALGDFPYIGLPTGYTSEGRDDLNKDFARFPFWVKGQPHWIEGKFYGAEFVPVDGKDMSEFEVKKNFETLIGQMGGQKVSEEKIPYDTVKAWGDEITMGFLAGLGDVYNEPATTYVIHRDEGDIWVHLVTNTAQGWYLVGQEKGFKQTAKLLPATELKKQLDSAGKVALQVNFATDKTEVLPESQPQLDQVVQLLKDDPALKLAVNGHTDNSGDAAHNQSLSEGRAKAVVAALTAQGIDAARLSAKGFGDTQPVADNGTDEGKAKNRRVELVKQ